MYNSNNLPIWYIYGAGGLGFETADILLESIKNGSVSPHQVAFLVDEPQECSKNGISITSFDECHSSAKITIAVGEPAVREKLAKKVSERGMKLASVISCRAFVSESAVIGDGSIVAPFASVQSMAVIGQNVSVNTQAIIGHDVHVSDGSVISSQVNLGGASVVESYSYIGMGAVVLEKVRIGCWAIIGMGSVVYKDVPDEMIALGNPARVARKNEDRKVFN